MIEDSFILRFEKPGNWIHCAFTVASANGKQRFWNTIELGQICDLTGFHHIEIECCIVVAQKIASKHLQDVFEIHRMQMIPKIKQTSRLLSKNSYEFLEKSKARKLLMGCETGGGGAKASCDVNSTRKVYYLIPFLIMMVQFLNVSK